MARPGRAGQDGFLPPTYPSLWRKPQRAHRISPFSTPAPVQSDPARGGTHQGSSPRHRPDGKRGRQRGYSDFTPSTTRRSRLGHLGRRPFGIERRSTRRAEPSFLEVFLAAFLAFHGIRPLPWLPLLSIRLRAILGILLRNLFESNNRHPRSAHATPIHRHRRFATLPLAG